MLERIGPIVAQREKFLRNLQQNVNSAFINRRFVTSVNNTTDDSLAYAHRNAQHVNQLEAKDPTGDPILHVHGNFERPNRAYVTNSHDYPDLLHMAIEKLRPGTGKKATKHTINGILEHEYAHSILVLGNPNVAILYSVDFFTDIKTGIFLIEPKLNFVGDIKLSTYREMLKAPPSPSTIDQVHM